MPISHKLNQEDNQIKLNQTKKEKNYFLLLRHTDSLENSKSVNKMKTEQKRIFTKRAHDEIN